MKAGNMTGNEGLFSGRKGESVFAEPFMDYRWSANELPAVLQRANAAGDDRSFVVFSFVIIEKYLDALLEAIDPGYQAVKDNRDFKASLKTEMLRALRLVPNRILQGGWHTLSVFFCPSEILTGCPVLCD